MLTDTITVTITKQDFQTTNYHDIKGCALCTALKRQLPENTAISSGGFTTTINKEKFWIYKSDGKTDIGNDIDLTYNNPKDLTVILKKMSISRLTFKL